MAAMAAIQSDTPRWVLPAALVAVGVAMMVIGASRQGDHAAAVWLPLGSALALFGSLDRAQWRLERGSPSESPALGCEASTSG